MSHSVRWHLDSYNKWIIDLSPLQSSSCPNAKRGDHFNTQINFILWSETLHREHGLCFLDKKFSTKGCFQATGGVFPEL